MQNIYLVRHGESMGNLNRDVYKTTPDHAIALSALGVQQATAAGIALKKHLSVGLGSENASGREPLQPRSPAPLRVWSSPYLRTRQTAERLVEQLQPSFPHLDQREHINLCEQQFGLFDGIPDEDLPTRFPAEHAHYELAASHEGRFWARMPLGESRFDVAIRVHQAFGTFHRDAERHNIRNIIIVCHGVTLRAFVMQWLHLPYEWFDKQPNPGNCDIYHIGGDSGQEGRYIYKAGNLIG